MRTAAMRNRCAVLLGAALLAGCASSSKAKQVPILLDDVSDLREQMDELQDSGAFLTPMHQIV